MISLPTNALIAIVTVSILSSSHLTPEAKTKSYYQQSILPVETQAVTHTEQHEHHRSPGKPGSTFAQLDKALFDADANQHTTMNLSFHTAVHQGQLLVTLSNDKGIEVLNPSRSWQFDLAQNQPIQLPIEIQTGSAGAYNLNLVVHHQVNGEIVQSRALAAQLQVGPKEAQKHFEKSASANPYPSVISMRAKETIR